MILVRFPPCTLVWVLGGGTKGAHIHRSISKTFYTVFGLEYLISDDLMMMRFRYITLVVFREDSSFFEWYYLHWCFCRGFILPIQIS